MLCVIMLFGLVPAGAISVFADTYDYTDPDNPYIATDYEGLMTVFNKKRTDGRTRYIKLGKNIEHPVFGTEFSLRTNGVDIEFDLCGYKLYVTEHTKTIGRFIVGERGRVIFSDSKRYDSSQDKWIDGSVEYRYTIYDDQPETTSVIAEAVTVKGGRFVNLTDYKWAPAKSIVYVGGGLLMYGGTFEAPLPIYMVAGEVQSVIYDGTINVSGRGGGIHVSGFSDPDAAHAYNPEIRNCEIFNKINCEYRPSVTLEFLDYRSSFTDEQKLEAYKSLFPYLKEIYINGERISDFTLEDLKPGQLYTYTYRDIHGPVPKRSMKIVSKTPVDEFYVISQTPFAGDLPSFFGYVYYGEGYKVNTINRGYIKDGVAWTDSSGNYMSGSAAFESGKNYTVFVFITTTDRNDYMFVDHNKCKAYVNGNPAGIYKFDDENYALTYTFNVKDRVIDAVNLTFPEPEAGKPIPYTISVPSGAHYSITDFTSGNYKNGVMWQKNGSQISPSSAGIFEYGNTYTAYILITPDSGYTFAPTGELIAAVNGDGADRVIDYGAYGGYCVVCSFYLGKTTIDTLEVTVPTPYAGSPIYYDAYAPFGEGYTVEDYSDGSAWESGVKWEHRGMTLNPQSNNHFEAGETYTVYVSLELRDIRRYEFAPSMSLEAYVNDNRADFDMDSDYICIVNYTFTVGEETCDIYWYLDVSNTEPTAGATVNRGDVFGSPSVPDREDEEFVGWYTDRALTHPYDPTAPITEDTELFASWKPKTPVGFVPGDVNGDGDLTMKDVLLMRRYIAGLDTLTDAQIERGDINGDGDIDMKDVLRARRIIAGLD